MVETETRYVIIIKYMLGKETYVTSAALAKAAGVSVRTVKYDLKELQAFLEPYRLKLESKRAYGYRLLTDEDSDLKGLSAALQTNLQKNKGEVFRYNFQRVIDIINKLLTGKPYYKAEELMDAFYVSRSTLTQDLNRVRTLISKFRLEIDVNLRRGIGITGDEIDKRLCIAEYFFRYDDKLQIMVQRKPQGGVSDWEQKRALLSQILLEACRSNNVSLPSFSAADLTNHMYVSILRIKEGYLIERLPDSHMVTGTGKEYRAARQIADQLEQLWEVEIPERERRYLALHILSKKQPDETFFGTEEQEVLKQCVREILREMKDNFELDFTNDPVFYDFLYMNIGPMVFRLRTHFIIRNPLLFENLRRYMFATKVAHSASGIIEKMFGVEMDNNEFAFLVPAVNMIISKHEKRKKFKIGFWGDLGRPETIICFNELAEFLPRDGYELVWIDRHCQAGELDRLSYLICIRGLSLGMYSQQVQALFQAELVHEIQEDASAWDVCNEIAQYRLRQVRLEQYLKPEFFVQGLGGRSRDEVMEQLYCRLAERELINAEMDWHKAFRANEIGNGIVHIQDLGRILCKAGCYVCVLKKPILWEQDIIRVLVMIKTKRDGDKDLSLLCRIVSNWASAPEKVEHLIKGQNYDIFCQAIKEECLKAF